MMTILSELYATGGDRAILHTIEIKSAAWGDSIFLVKDWQDHTITTEGAVTAVATACGMDIAIPKRNDNPSQSLTFALKGVRQEAAQRVRSALYQGEQVQIVYRPYIEGQLSAPADTPLTMVAKEYRASGGDIEVSAGIYDITSLGWPRKLYDPLFAPGIKYL